MCIIEPQTRTILNVPPFYSYAIWNLRFPLLLQQKEKTRKLFMGSSLLWPWNDQYYSLLSASSMTLPNCKVTRNMRENLECLTNITIPAMPAFSHMPIFRSGLGPEDDILLLLCLGHMSTRGWWKKINMNFFRDPVAPGQGQVLILSAEQILAIRKHSFSQVFPKWNFHPRWSVVNSKGHGACVSWKGEDTGIPDSWLRPHAWEGCQGRLITNIYQWPGTDSSVGETSLFLAMVLCIIYFVEKSDSVW